MDKLILIENRALLEVSGEDAKSFLQGLITNDTALISGTRSIYAAFLTPQGKFLHDLFISQIGEALFLECERDLIEDIKKRLSLYKLRAKVTVAEGEFKVYGVIGENVLTKLGLPALEGSAKDFEGGKMYVDPRLSKMGARLLLPIDKHVENLGFEAGAFADYDQLRLKYGLPDGTRDMKRERAIPLECGLDELNAISWTKGCYLGQQLTARTKHLGLVRKRLMPVEIEGPAPEFGTPVTQGDKDAGEMLSSNGNFGLMRLRLEALENSEKLRAGEATITPHKPEWMKI